MRVVLNILPRQLYRSTCSISVPLNLIRNSSFVFPNIITFVFSSFTIVWFDLQKDKRPSICFCAFETLLATTFVCPETCWNKWSRLKYLHLSTLECVFIWVRTRLNLPHPIMLSSGAVFTLTNTGNNRYWSVQGITVSLNEMTRMFADILISMETVHLWCFLM